MTPHLLLSATDEELSALSDLCLLSKAHWGYDADFIAACVDVLRITRDSLIRPTAVIRTNGGFAGIAQIDLTSDKAALSKLFVCPKHMRRGVGRALIQWAKSHAKAEGHTWVHVESDPQAEPFYLKHGAIRIGDVPSEVSPNRVLPLLNLPTSVT